MTRPWSNDQGGLWYSLSSPVQNKNEGCLVQKLRGNTSPFFHSLFPNLPCHFFVWYLTSHSPYVAVVLDRGGQWVAKNPPWKAVEGKDPTAAEHAPQT
jgi:hypothetical protein